MSDDKFRHLIGAPLTAGEFVARGFGIGGFADEGYYLINARQCYHQPRQDMAPVAGFF